MVNLVISNDYDLIMINEHNKINKSVKFDKNWAENNFEKYLRKCFDTYCVSNFKD